MLYNTKHGLSSKSGKNNYFSLACNKNGLYPYYVWQTFLMTRDTSHEICPTSRVPKSRVNSLILNSYLLRP